jgi:excisionase family DNA binding protein
MLRDKFMSLSEVSALKGLTTSHLRRLIITGKIKAQKVGCTWLMAQKDVASLKRKRAKKD